MINKLVFISTCFFVFSCNSDENDEMPVNLIDESKMINLIVDLQILESHYQRTFHNPYSYHTSLKNSSEIIFEKYQVTSGQFDTSYNYYSFHIDKLYKIYESALDSLNFSSID